MLVTRKSMLTGIEHTLEIKCTEKELKLYYESNIHIQDVFPNLSKDEREFIKTGITSEEWEDEFGIEE